MTPLGVVNFMPEKPPELVRHYERVAEGEEHEVGVTVRGCVRHYTCLQCGIEWETDTSG